MSKRCPSCKEYKPLEDYQTNRRNKDGKNGYCRACMKIKDRDYYLKNRDKHDLGTQKWYAENKAAVRIKRSILEKKRFSIPEERAKQYERTNVLRKRYPEKEAARIALRNAVRMGKVEKSPCLVCGEKKVAGHHFDYALPLVVIWLCSNHHVEHHMILNKTKVLINHLKNK